MVHFPMIHFYDPCRVGPSTPDLQSNIREHNPVEKQDPAVLLLLLKLECAVGITLPPLVAQLHSQMVVKYFETKFSFTVPSHCVNAKF
jgi:hypothetical protein